MISIAAFPPLPDWTMSSQRRPAVAQNPCDIGGFRIQYLHLLSDSQSSSNQFMGWER